MDFNLTEYQKSKFPHLDDILVEKWYKIDKSRPDYDAFISCLYRYNEAWKLLSIDLENNRFKKTYHPKSIEWAKQNNIEL